MILTLNKIEWKYILIGLLYFPPGLIAAMPGLDIFRRLINYSALCISVYSIFIILNQKKISRDDARPIGLVLLLILWTSISTIVNNGLGGCISFLIIALRLLGYLCILWKGFIGNELMFYFEGTSIYCELICILNVISQLIYPNGIYYDSTVSWQGFYLCGNGNSYYAFYLFTMAVLVQKDILQQEKISITTLLFNVVLLFSMSLEDSSTGLVIMLLSLIMVVFSGSKVKKLIKKKYRFFLGLFFGVSTWLIIFQGWDSQWIKDCVKRILLEDKSFNERGLIWTNTLNNIKYHMLFGMGAATGSSTADSDGILRSTHNTFLQITTVGGIPALIFFIMIIFCGYNSLKKSRKLVDNAVYYMVIFISLYMVVYLVEQNPWYTGFYALIFLAHLYGCHSNNSMASLFYKCE